MFLVRSLLLFIFVLLSGCTIPKTNLPDFDNAKTKFVLKKNKPVKVQNIHGFISTDDGLSYIADRNVFIEMRSPLTLDDFFQLLLCQGINVVTRFTDDSEQEQSKNTKNIVKDKKTTSKFKDTIYISKYSGSLKRLLKRVQLSCGLFYDYSDSVLVVKETNPVYIKVIMPGIEDDLIKLLESYGIENAFYDRLSNRIVFESDYFKYSKLRDYFRNNNYLTLVNFDVLVLESESENSADFGIDWSKFSMILNESLNAKASFDIDSVAGDGTYSGSLSWDILTLNSFFSSIQDFHRFRVVQTARISSLNGNECVLDVSEKVPYVSEVTLGSLNDDSDSVVQGYTFSTALSGIVITLKPNVVDDFITLSFKAEIQNISEYVKVGTDSQIQQPVVAVRNIDNDLILMPGTVQLVGGLKYEKGNIRKSGLVDVSEKLGLRSISDRTFMLTVLLRSEIIKYVFV